MKAKHLKRNQKPAILLLKQSLADSDLQTGAMPYLNSRNDVLLPYFDGRQRKSELHFITPNPTFPNSSNITLEKSPTPLKSNKPIFTFK